LPGLEWSKLALAAQAAHDKMLKHPEITERRIEQFIAHVLEPSLFPDACPLKLAFCADGYSSGAEAAAGEFVPVEEGFKWGPVWRTVWFKATGAIPKGWAGKEVAARLETGGERTVWKGTAPVAGVDWAHTHYRLARHAKGGERVELLIQAYGAYPDVRVHGTQPEWPPLPFEVGEISLRTFDRELWHFYLDCKFNLDLLRTLPTEDVARAHILRGLNDAVNRFDPERRDTLAEAKRHLREQTASKRTDRYHTLTPVGHAHLDTAWLWPLEITRHKMAHTAATQLALMEDYPEYIFVHSQAAQYEWIEQEHPQLFSQIKEKALKGQWEPLGSMWVEADCNLAGGEALVRQFLYGKRYFKQKFDIDTRDMWLPDVFGYSAAIPQILTKFGIDYFLTQKISWNQFNKFPHNTFWWQGIDGSKIWTHFPPADTYCGMCTPAELQKHLTTNRDPARSDLGLYVFGYGDGGGGPTAQHIEFLRRAAKAPSMPQVQWRRATEFFREAKERSRDLPTWAGELYFELHRGTYTTQAANKRYNRLCEFLLRDAELLACLHPDFPASYPALQIEALWKTVLLNQFHDILPGSSIKEVYDESHEQYEQVIDETRQIIRDAMAAIARDTNTADMTKPIALFKFADIASEGRIKATKGDPPRSLRAGSDTLPVQEITEFGEKLLIFATPESCLGNVAVCDMRSEPSPSRPRLIAKSRRLENDTWSVRFDQHGNITSIVSLEDQTEYIEQGKLANLFQIFDDRPLFWSAWDVDIFALETQKDLIRSERFEIVERGPVRVAVELEKSFGQSRIIQRISLGPTPGIRFDTFVDWRESEKMLKVAFPVNVNAARATYEIQYGNVERPTHMNTSWDMARFEVCAQKWTDLSEGDHGVALLNEGKYGHDVHGNVMRLTLLRSPKAPDPTADMGVHRFTYALFPHFGPYNWAGVVQAAYALNAPLHARFLDKHPGGNGSDEQFVSCEDRNIVIEAVKKAEDSDAVIVRVYEAHNARGTAELDCGRLIEYAALCDLAENEISELEINDGAVTFDYKPFEILTIKLVLR
jgi:alpha-mannosidase